MLFKVSDFKLFNKMVAFSNDDDFSELTKFLRKKQPVLFEEIQQVSYDPRCFEAAKFGLLFCGIALEQAELIRKCKLSKITVDRFGIARKLIAQDNYNFDKHFVKIN